MALTTVETLQNTTGYSESFLYSLSQQQAETPTNIPAWFESKSTLRTLVDMANEAVDWAEDQYSAQICLDAAAAFINSPESGFIF